LTTVVQPSVEKGRRAGELLNNPPRSGLPVNELLDTEVVRGRTSGPPA
jgi:DNA-binding LacI/PurR family transcriptional regulator